MKQKVNLKVKIPFKEKKSVSNDNVLIFERSRDDVKSNSNLKSQDTNLNVCTTPLELSFKSSLKNNSNIPLTKISIKKDLKVKNIKNKKKKFIKKGNLILLFFNKNKIPIIVLGPDWSFILLGTIFLIFSSFIYFIITYKSINFYIQIIGFILTLFQLIFYLLTSFLNPGIQLKKPKKEDKDSITCDYCGVIKTYSLKQKHCFYCDVCIIGYENHCTWTGKCIGYKNKIYFNVFLYLCFFNIFNLIVIILFLY